MAEILPATESSARFLAAHLGAGGIAAVPTETVYGLAADGLNPDAVALIFRAKKRPVSNPLILHFASTEQLAGCIGPGSLPWSGLAERFWPGPLTLVLPRSTSVPGIVTANRETVAVRIPDLAITRQVITFLGRPIAAPSANPSGYLSPTCARHVAESFGQEVPFILDGGPCRQGIESTILALLPDSPPRILRPGPISKEAIEACLQTPVVVDASIEDPAQGQLSPGRFASHYQPHTPLYLHRGPIPLQASASGTAYLHFQVSAEQALPKHHYSLCHQNEAEAAHRLYSVLHTLDPMGYRQILVESAPDTPLGRSLNDRLQRAASGEYS